MWHFLDTSSEVHLYSSPLFITDYTRGVAFSITLSTLALYQSTLWCFDALPCRTTSVGRFHHLTYSCVTTFSRSLLSAHISVVRDLERFILWQPNSFLEVAKLNFWCSARIMLIQSSLSFFLISMIFHIRHGFTIL